MPSIEYDYHYEVDLLMKKHSNTGHKIATHMFKS